MGEKQTKENEESDTDQAEAQKVLLNDSFLKRLVVQRSRAYVKKSQEQIMAAARLFSPCANSRRWPNTV